MFSPTGRFKEIPCPRQGSCVLLNCFFLHYTQPEDFVSSEYVSDLLDVALPRKRRKIIVDTVQAPQKADGRKDAESHVYVEESLLLESSTTRPPRPATQRPITPPPVRRSIALENSTLVSTKLNVKSIQKPEPIHDRQASLISQTDLPVPGKQKTAKAQAEEKLNPRKLLHDPAGHHIRLIYVTKMHEEMVRLNKQVMLSKDPELRAVLLTSQQLITLTLDEEENIAKESPAVYANTIKLRIMAYRKMQVAQWKTNRIEQRRKTIVEKDTGRGTCTIPAPIFRIVSGLSRAEEVRLLSYMLANQQGLDKFGYVTSVPAEADVAVARAGIEAAQGWEQCDRCRTRFQVFPDRREDGALTSGGVCTYHWGRLTRPQRERTDAVTGHKEALFSCCGESVGSSAGCTTAASHVYKISAARGLAAVMQFQATPENPMVGAGSAVSFDCEMGYTVKGFELIRLTAISWPEGRPLLDVLVRPLGTVLDLNSRFSGVLPDHLTNAVPYEAVPAVARDDAASTGKLAIVDSPIIARDLLLKLLSPGTPLIGHAIENDLNATRIVHPSIIDTVLLFPHPRGLPLRKSLKALAKQYLGRDIQTGGASGHDSHEDAKATGDVVRESVKRKWQEMQRDGWTLDGGNFVKPRNDRVVSPGR